MSLGVRVWLSILLAALLAYTGVSAWRIYSDRNSGAVYAGSPMDAYGSSNEPAIDVTATPARPASIRDVADVKLTDQSGQPFAIKSLEGQVWIGSFFFASCPGPCRQINVAISQLQNELRGKDVKFVSITVDPDNDTPQVLGDYAKSFGADRDRWRFLTGDFNAIRRICADVFAMPIDRKVHTERLLLIDRQGVRRGIFSTGDPAQMLALKKGVDKLLDEKPQQLDEKPQAGATPGPAAGAKERS
jgi:cytochrome oxidase Cu insertion factor (SCO1/SenC/PrrC family)